MASSRLTPHQSDLCGKFLRIVPKYAAHFAYRQGISDVDSVESEMLDGLIRCVQKHENPDELLVKRAMWDAAMDWWRSETTTVGERGPDPLNKVCDSFEEECVVRRPRYQTNADLEHMSYEDDTLGRMIAEEDNKIVDAAMLKLNAREREIVVRHTNGEPFHQIAEDLQITRQGCEYIYHQCIQKLRVECGVK